MKILVYDTETTWFMNKKEIDNLDAQPYMVQFAGIMWEIDADWNFTELKRINELVKPKIPIPYGSSQVHHIYDIDVKDKPQIEDKIDELVWYLNEADFVIGHNVEYDDFIMTTELKRVNKHWAYKAKNTFCTMKSTVDFVAVRWNGERFKYPKLWELHKKLFWEYFMWAHDAMVDVEATVRCVQELVKIGQISLEPKEELTLF